jgi:hypothetical protein
MLKGQANIIYNQIWLNLPMDDRNFGYKTKLTQKKKKKKPMDPNLITSALQTQCWLMA